MLTEIVSNFATINYNQNTINMKATLSKRGIPCLWECGGAGRNTGEATVIADPQGKPKTPIYIKQKGMLACAEHALIPISVGDVVITTRQHRGDHTTTIVRIDSLSSDGEYTTTPVSHFSDGEWDNDDWVNFAQAVEAAWAKSLSYHCREPFYIKLPKPTTTT